MEFINGLVSVSFRSLSYPEIIRAASAGSLSAIEWGGDIHVPAGDEKIAEEVRLATAKAGISIPEYGSYYTLGLCDRQKSDAMLRSARALKTDTVRVWAANKSPDQLTKEEYFAAIEDAIRLCSENSDLTFCLECHNRTITEDHSSAINFLRDVNCPNLQMFWQPNQFKDHQYNLRSVTALLPYIRSVHVFAWEGEKHLPLQAHSERWRDYISILKSSPNEKLYLMLEFMHDNSPLSLPSAAEALRSFI